MSLPSNFHLSTLSTDHLPPPPYSTTPSAPIASIPPQEKNPTIVNFPVKNLELRDIIPLPEGELLFSFAGIGIEG